MAVKIYKPITPSLRNMTGYTFEEITKKKPERSLIVFRKQHAGRNNDGRITVRHRGGGRKRFIRSSIVQNAIKLISRESCPLNMIRNRTATWLFFSMLTEQKLYLSPDRFEGRYGCFWSEF